jgi:hypothetical protein
MEFEIQAFIPISNQAEEITIDFGSTQNGRE